MAERYPLTPPQVAALRALSEEVVELSPLEVAVRARLLPDQSRTALMGLQHLGLVNSWVPVFGRSPEHLYVLTGEGRAIARALSESQGIPPIGAVVRVPRQFPTFSGWISGQQFSPDVEIVPEATDSN